MNWIMSVWLDNTVFFFGNEIENEAGMGEKVKGLQSANS